MSSVKHRNAKKNSILFHVQVIRQSSWSQIFVACDAQRVSGQTLRQRMAMHSFIMQFVHLLQASLVDRSHCIIVWRTCTENIPTQLSLCHSPPHKSLKIPCEDLVRTCQTNRLYKQTPYPKATWLAWLLFRWGTSLARGFCASGSQSLMTPVMLFPNSIQLLLSLMQNLCPQAATLANKSLWASSLCVPTCDMQKTNNPLSWTLFPQDFHLMNLQQLGFWPHQSLEKNNLGSHRAIVLCAFLCIFVLANFKWWWHGCVQGYCNPSAFGNRSWPRELHCCACAKNNHAEWLKMVWCSKKINPGLHWSLWPNPWSSQVPMPCYCRNLALELFGMLWAEQLEGPQLSLPSKEKPFPAPSIAKYTWLNRRWANEPSLWREVYKRNCDIFRCVILRYCCPVPPRPALCQGVPASFGQRNKDITRHWWRWEWAVWRP